MDGTTDTGGGQGQQQTQQQTQQTQQTQQVDTLAIAREAKKSVWGEIDEAVAQLGHQRPNGMSTKDFVTSLLKKGGETEKALTELKTSTEANATKTLTTLVKKAVSGMDWDSAHAGLKDALVSTATSQLIANHKISINDNMEVVLDGETFDDAAKKYVGAYLKTTPPPSPDQKTGQKSVDKPDDDKIDFSKPGWNKLIKK